MTILEQVIATIETLSPEEKQALFDYLQTNQRIPKPARRIIGLHRDIVTSPDFDDDLLDFEDTDGN